MIDREHEPSDFENLGSSSGPDWVQGDLLLRVAVDGKAKLYHYKVKEYSLFFFSLDGSPIEQLVSKNYVNPDDRLQIITNRMYIGQLRSSVFCGDDLPVNQQVAYQLRPLAKYFKDFNKCSGDVPTEDLTPPDKQFTLRMTPGVNFMRVSGNEVYSGRKWDWNNKISFRLGLDLEFTWPFKKKNWAVIAEPNLYRYKATSDPGSATIDIKAVELPAGIRHKFFLSEKNFIFVNAIGILSFPIRHELRYKFGNVESEINEQKGIYGYALGAGIAVGRLSLEGRYYGEIDRTGEDTQVGYVYNKSTIILGVQIF